jgi:alkylation response protein AidB-like acyl-CoA dehydrogenase
MGPYAAPYLQDVSDAELPLGDEAAAKAASSYFNNRKLSIFGGSNEIQKNIISKMILGL